MIPVAKEATEKPTYLLKRTTTMLFLTRRPPVPRHFTYQCQEGEKPQKQRSL